MIGEEGFKREYCLRHNEVRDMTGKLLEEVCKDVRKKLMLMRLNGEQFRLATANQRPEARLREGEVSVSNYLRPFRFDL